MPVNHSFSLKPPASVAKNAEKGLKLRQQFQRGGTQVGINRAQQLQKREELTADTVKRMYSYFKRHEIDKKAEHFADPENPSKGYIAWLLWGGDEGFAWVKQVHEKLKNVE